MSQNFLLCFRVRQDGESRSSEMLSLAVSSRHCYISLTREKYQLLQQRGTGLIAFPSFLKMLKTGMSIVLLCDIEQGKYKHPPSGKLAAHAYLLTQTQQSKHGTETRSRGCWGWRESADHTRMFIRPDIWCPGQSQGGTREDLLGLLPSLTSLTALILTYNLSSKSHLQRLSRRGGRLWWGARVHITSWRPKWKHLECWYWSQVGFFFFKDKCQIKVLLTAEVHRKCSE